MAGRARQPSSPSPSPATQSQVTLPHLVTNPIWSLKLWPVVVEIAGCEYTIPALCAADWLEVLMEPTLTPEHVFPGMLDLDEQRQVDEVLHSGQMDLEEFYNLGLEAIGEISGRPWWVALRLIYVAQQSWDALGGEMAEKADAGRLSLSAWLDILFLLVVRNIDDAKRTMFLMKLELAPEGWGPDPEELEMSADAFLALAD